MCFRGRMETRNGKHEWWENGEKREQEEVVGNLTWQQPNLSFPHFLLHPSFTHVNAFHPEYDLLKVLSLSIHIHTYMYIYMFIYYFYTNIW